MRPLILIIVCCFSLARAQITKIVYDSTIKAADISKIKNIPALMKYSKTCKIYQYKISWNCKGKLKSEIFNPSDSLNTRFHKYLDDLEKGCYIVIEVLKASCKQTIGYEYKFRII
jgi:hypothetical protein